MTKKYKHVMIDIEGMGKSPNAPIVAIGAVFFDPLKKEIGPDFYSRITLESSMRKGAQPDASTIIYWLSQSDAARNEIINATESIQAALLRLNCFLVENATNLDSLRVWGNGPTYDIVITENAYRLCGLEIPWNFYRVRDVRTAVEFGRWDNFDPKYQMPFDGVQHNAAHDARHQARYVSEIVARLFKSNEPATQLLAEPVSQAGGDNGQ